MNPRATTATRVLGFLAVLAVVFVGAWAAGARVGPVGLTAEHDAGHRVADLDHTDEGEMGGSAGATASSGVPGLAVAQAGYRLVLADTVVEPGDRTIAFTVEGPDGRPVTGFDVEHERELHLIVVRRDHTGFQHVHPALDDATGRWTARADLTPGQWRVFADFTVSGGPPLVLASDLLVPGHLAVPQPVREVRTDTVDGYTVAVEGALRAGKHSALVFRVLKDGGPVTDLQPYLGAYGHLVALREGDLAFLHVHPGGAPGDGETRPGPDVPFTAEVPSTGRYHLYLDFRHGGVVRTAHLVLDTHEEGRE